MRFAAIAKVGSSNPTRNPLGLVIQDSVTAHTSGLKMRNQSPRLAVVEEPEYALINMSDHLVITSTPCVIVSDFQLEISVVVCHCSS